MGEVIAFRRPGAPTPPIMHPSISEKLIDMSKAFVDPETPKRVSNSVNELFDLQGDRSFPVYPKISPSMAPNLNISHDHRVGRKRINVEVPVAFLNVLEKEAYLSRPEASQVVADFTYTFGSILFGVNDSRSFYSVNAGIPNIRGLSDGSFEPEQWPSFVRPKNVFAHRAAAAVALHANDLSDLHIGCPDQPPSDVDNRSMQIAALSNPYDPTELKPLKPYIEKGSIVVNL